MKVRRESNQGRYRLMKMDDTDTLGNPWVIYDVENEDAWMDSDTIVEVKP